VPQTAAAAVLCITDRAEVQPIVSKVKALSTQDFNVAAKQPHAVQSCRLMMDLPTLKGWKAELAWMVDP